MKVTLSELFEKAVKKETIAEILLIATELKQDGKSIDELIKVLKEKL